MKINYLMEFTFGRVIYDAVMNAYLCWLGVHFQYRRKGIATKIINILIKYCKENKRELVLQNE